MGKFRRKNPLGTPLEFSVRLHRVPGKAPRQTSSVPPPLAAEVQGVANHSTVETINVELVQALVKVATDAWRMQRKMVEPDSTVPKEEFKRVYRHIDSIMDALAEAQIELRDPTGANYDSGMALRVVSFEDMENVNRETVKETIKPAILWKGQLVQHAEVIIGTPVENSND